MIRFIRMIPARHHPLAANKRSRGVLLLTATLSVMLLGIVAWAQPEQPATVFSSQQGTLGMPGNLGAVANPAGANNYLVTLSWEAASNAQGHLVYVVNAKDPGAPISSTYLAANAVETTVALPGGETYEFEVGAYIGNVLYQSEWNWSGRKAFSVGVQEIITALPLTLRDDLEVVYVADTSGSMSGTKINKLKQSLEDIRDRGPGILNTRAALVDFDSSWRVVFNLTETGSGSWTQEWTGGIASLSAGGGTRMYRALQAANDMLPDTQVCPTPATCRKREIVLLSDGLAGDSGLETQTVAALVAKGIVVRTFAFGADADKEALKRIADATGGHFTEVQ